MNEWMSVFKDILFLSRYGTDIHRTPETGIGFLNFSIDFLFNSSSDSLFLFTVWTVFFAAIVIILSSAEIKHFMKFNINLPKRKRLFRNLSWLLFGKSLRIAVSFYASYLFMLYSKASSTLIDITNVSFYLGIAFLFTTLLPGIYSDRLSLTGLKPKLKKEYFFSLIVIFLLFLSAGIFKVSSPQNMDALFFLSAVFFFISLTAINLALSLCIFTLCWSNWHEYVLISIVEKGESTGTEKIINSFFEAAIESGEKEKLQHLSFEILRESDPIFDVLRGMNTEQFTEKAAWLADNGSYTQTECMDFIRKSIFRSFEHRLSCAHTKPKAEKNRIHSEMYGLLGKITGNSIVNRSSGGFAFPVCEKFLKIIFLKRLNCTEEDSFTDFFNFISDKDGFELLSENLKSTANGEAYAGSVLLNFFSETGHGSGFTDSVGKDMLLRLISYAGYFLGDFFKRNGMIEYVKKERNAVKSLNTEIKSNLSNVLNAYLKNHQNHEFMKAAVAACILSDIELGTDIYYLYDDIDKSVWDEIIERNRMIKGKLFCDMFDYIHISNGTASDAKREIYTLLLARNEFCPVFLREGHEFFNAIDKSEFNKLYSLYKKNLNIYESMNIFLSEVMYESEGSKMEIEKIMGKIRVIQASQIR